MALVALLLSFHRLHLDARQPSPRPLTPAGVALLSNDLNSSDIERLRAAVTHGDATVRGIAARVAGVARVTTLTNDVRAALEREQDERAAAEQVRALLLFGGTGVEAAEAHLARAPMRALGVYLEWLARTKPDDVAQRTEKFVGRLSSGDATSVAREFGSVVLQNPGGRARLLRTWLQVASGDTWRTVLERLEADWNEQDAAVLGEALASADETTRRETVWAIVTQLAHGVAIPRAALDAALARPSATTDSSATPTWEGFGRELVTRRHQQVSTPDRAEFLKSEATRHKSDARWLPLLSELTADERSAVESALGTYAVKSGEERPPWLDRRQQPSMRTVPLPWPGLLPELLKESGCKPRRTDHWGVFEISYRADGRPASVNLDPTALSRECQPALAALARMTLADGRYEVREGERQQVLVPVNKDFLSCVVDVPRLDTARPISPGRIDPPKKIRNVRPVYPPAAQQSHIQGVVILEATLSTSGCPIEIVILRSIPGLDFAALHAVSGWRFTPTLLEGKPVPVIMTVTVNFTLE